MSIFSQIYSAASCTSAANIGDGLRWIERPQDAGLRFVGFADELAREYGAEG